MDSDIAKLAAETAALLAPFLPYLIKGGKIAAQKAFEKSGEKLADAAWDKAEKVWGKIWPKAKKKEAAKEAIEDAAQHPKDVDAQGAFRRQLNKLLESDEKLRQFVIENITIDMSTNIQANDHSVALGGNMVDSTTIVGNRNLYIGQLQVFLDEKYGKKSDEREKVEKAYLTYLEKLRRHCLALPLAALGGEESTEEDITLDHIYIELDTTQMKETPEGKSPRMMKVGDREIPVPGEKNPPVSVMEAVRESKRSVLLGNAGAGKSTFVKKLLAWQAAALMGECAPPTDFSPELIPILVILRNLAPRLALLQLGNLSAEKQNQVLSEAILDEIGEEIKSYKAADFIPALRDAIENGKVLLAFDGLDEVPQDLRNKVRQAVGALQIHHIERIIITSRSRSYTGQAVFQNFQPFTIAPLDEEKISKFATAWYNEQHRLGRIHVDMAEKRASDLASAAVTPDLIEMSSNPMMLTSIAIIHQKDIGLPRERVRLYRLIVDVLISRWQKYKTGDESFAPSQALMGFLKDDNRLRAALERLAYETHRAGKAPANHEVETSDLSRSTALGLLEAREYLGDLSLASEFLDYVDQRAGLLVGKGGELERPTSYSFPHRTIQEYLAGCYLIGKRERGREFYSHAADGDFWSLAALMGAEELFYNRRGTDALLDLAYDLCPADKPNSEQDERSLLWSGQIASIVGTDIIQRDTGKPSGGKAYLQRLIPRTVELLESSLPPRERAEAGDTLARIGDPRVGATKDFLFCEIPAGNFMMGSKKEDDPLPLDSEYPQFKYDIPYNYFMSRYPITNAQFDLFVKADGYKLEEYWGEAKQAGYWSKGGFKGEYDDEARTAPVNYNAPFNLSNHPVVGVSWFEALAFTRWATKNIEHSTFNVWKDGKIKTLELEDGKCEIRLPTEAEWEKAARGTKGLRYPWGNDITPNHANYSDTNIGTTSAVGAFPLGMNDYGLLDMSGNVWEWTRSLWGKNPQKPDYRYPYDKDDGRENIEAGNDFLRVVRGGAFGSRGRLVRCAYRLWYLPVNGWHSLGFRVVVCVVSPISR